MSFALQTSTVKSEISGANDLENVRRVKVGTTHERKGCDTWEAVEPRGSRKTFGRDVEMSASRHRPCQTPLRLERDWYLDQCVAKVPRIDRSLRLERYSRIGRQLDSCPPMREHLPRRDLRQRSMRYTRFRGADGSSISGSLCGGQRAPRRARTARWAADLTSPRGAVSRSRPNSRPMSSSHKSRAATKKR